MSNYPPSMTYEDLIAVGEIDNPFDDLCESLRNSHKGESAPVTPEDLCAEAREEVENFGRQRRSYLAGLEPEDFAELADEINSEIGIETHYADE